MLSLKLGSKELLLFSVWKIHPMKLAILVKLEISYGGRYTPRINLILSLPIQRMKWKRVDAGGSPPVSLLQGEQTDIHTV